MSEVPNINELVTSVARTIPGDFSLVEEQAGRVTAWITLSQSDDLFAAARSLKAIGARLSMITAMADQPAGINTIAYHFDIKGSTVTLKVGVEPGGSVATIVPLFRNADWHEREFMELYDLHVSGRADSKRLFLDETVDRRVMQRLIPLSVLSNAASTTMLFEKLIVDREKSK
jgi:NADH:ubiquinone oxidoreductase subunit C